MPTALTAAACGVAPRRAAVLCSEAAGKPTQRGCWRSALAGRRSMLAVRTRLNIVRRVGVRRAGRVLVSKAQEAAPPAAAAGARPVICAAQSAFHIGHKGHSSSLVIRSTGFRQRRQRLVAPVCANARTPSTT